MGGLTVFGTVLGVRLMMTWFDLVLCFNFTGDLLPNFESSNFVVRVFLFFSGTQEPTILVKNNR